MKNRLLVLTFLLFWCNVFTAQVEMLKPLNGNRVLMQQRSIEKKNNSVTQKRKTQQSSLSSSNDTLYMPFFDDFSYNGPYPDSNKWHKYKQVYVNRGYAIAPPTMGAATFDGLDEGGYPYNIFATSGSFMSDTLISKPLRLDYTDASHVHHLSPHEDSSVYLSFYYQVKGRGDMPESNDALNLLFFTADDTVMDFNNNIVWSKNGSSTPLAPGDTNFHRVIMPILRSLDDTVFFTHGLKIAFNNYSTKCGAVDHFHIDQVYLNYNRDQNDTIFKDISFVYDGQSLLKDTIPGSALNYSQMPYTQFSGSANMRKHVSAVLRNNYNKKTSGQWSGQANITTQYKIVDNTGTSVLTQTCGTNNVFNYDSIGYCNDHALINPSLNFTYNNGPFADTTSYQVKFYLWQNTSGDTIPRNDTAYFRQNFQNYYSYDDGSAEAGYYVSAYEGEMAVRYKLNYKEKLRALDIFFDPIIGVNLIKNTEIHLKVWGDYLNKPYNTLANDSLMLDSSRIYPNFYTNGYNLFTRYELTHPVEIDSGQIFYVGIYQQTNQPLGVGYDLNTDNHSNVLFFDPSGGSGLGWQTSFYKGSLMIHPLFGDSLMAVGVRSVTQEKQSVKIYPNPASDEIYLVSSDKINKVVITDILGNVLYEERNPSQRVDVSSLSGGVYLVRTQTDKGAVCSQKLVISK